MVLQLMNSVLVSYIVILFSMSSFKCYHCGLQAVKAEENVQGRIYEHSWEVVHLVSTSINPPWKLQQLLVSSDTNKAWELEQILAGGKKRNHVSKSTFSSI